MTGTAGREAQIKGQAEKKRVEHQDSPAGGIGRGEQQERQNDTMFQAEHQDIKVNEKGRDERMQGQAEQLGKREEDDPYVMAWVAWKERDESGKKEKSERLERRKKPENSWNMVKLCGEIIKENYSSWKERKVTEKERKELE